MVRDGEGKWEKACEEGRGAEWARASEENTWRGDVRGGGERLRKTHRRGNCKHSTGEGGPGTEGASGRKSVRGMGQVRVVMWVRT